MGFHNLFALDDIGFSQFSPLENPFGVMTASANVNVLLGSFVRNINTNSPLLAFSENQGKRTAYLLGENSWKWRLQSHVDTKSYENIIDDIVDNYLKAIELNVSVSQLKLKNVCVYNVVPTTQKYNTSENHVWPYLGTDEERKQYTLYFNEKIKEKCIEKGYIFFDIYNHYIDENGFLRKDLSDGNVHIRNGVYITNFIKENNL